MIKIIEKKQNKKVVCYRSLSTLITATTLIVFLTSVTVDSFSTPRSKTFVRTSLTTSQSLSSTKLSLGKNDDSLEPKLSFLKKSFESMQNTPRKWLIDEFKIVEKVLEEDIEAAEKAVSNSFVAAESVIENTLAEGLKITGANAPSEILTSIKAAETVAETVATSAAADAAAVADLKAVSDNIFNAMRKAQNLVSSIDDYSTIDEKIIKYLQSTEEDVTQSMKVAEAIAETVSNAASSDSAAIKLLETAGEKVVNSIESAETIAEAAVKDINADFRIVKSIESTASDVMRDMKAAESVAETIANNAVLDAKAVESIQSKAADLVDSIRAVELAATSGASSEDMRSILLNAVDKINTDVTTVEEVTKIVTSDVNNNAIAVAALKSVDRGVAKLIESAEKVIDGTGDANVLEKEAEKMADTMKEVESSVETCVECSLKTAGDALHLTEEIMVEDVQNAQNILLAKDSDSSTITVASSEKDPHNDISKSDTTNDSEIPSVNNIEMDKTDSPFTQINADFSADTNDVITNTLDNTEADQISSLDVERVITSDNSKDRIEFDSISDKTDLMDTEETANNPNALNTFFENTNDSKEVENIAETFTSSTMESTKTDTGLTSENINHSTDSAKVITDSINKIETDENDLLDVGEIVTADISKDKNIVSDEVEANVKVVNTVETDETPQVIPTADSLKESITLSPSDVVEDLTKESESIDKPMEIANNNLSDKNNPASEIIDKLDHSEVSENVMEIESKMLIADASENNSNNVEAIAVSNKNDDLNDNLGQILSNSDEIKDSEMLATNDQVFVIEKADEMVNVIDMTKIDESISTTPANMEMMNDIVSKEEVKAQPDVLSDMKVEVAKISDELSTIKSSTMDSVDHAIKIVDEMSDSVDGIANIAAGETVALSETVISLINSLFI